MQLTAMPRALLSSAAHASHVSSKGWAALLILQHVMRCRLACRFLSLALPRAALAPSKAVANAERSFETLLGECRSHWNAEISTKNFWWMYWKAAVRGSISKCGCFQLGWVPGPPPPICFACAPGYVLRRQIKAGTMSAQTF